MYRYRNETIIGYLGIDDEEQKALGFYPANVHCYEERQKARERGQKRRKMKEKRDIKIIELFAKGVLQEKIAELVGCAQSTVSKILKAAGITKKKTERCFLCWRFGLCCCRCVGILPIYITSKCCRSS